MPIMHVVSISSGKDSTATMLLALQRFPKNKLRFVFADTGNEHELVYEYLNYLEERLDIKIDRLRADFSRQIKNKRKFIANDQRVGRKKGKKIRWSNKAKRRALESLVVTGNPYLDLCAWKGRFPSRRAQFCTEFLKKIPLVKYQHGLIDHGYTVISWQGVRRDESDARRDVKKLEKMDTNFWQYRPIADWNAQQIFDFLKKCDVEPNPLYKLGMNRVGCMPCINAAKAEIREIAIRFPSHMDRIEQWEYDIALASKINAASFFSNTDRSMMDVPSIRKKIEWAKTAYGGRQYDLFSMIEDETPPACKSSYGLCE